MAVGGVGWDASKKSSKLLLVTNGTVDEIAQDFRSTPDVVGSVTVNISYIIRRLRAKAVAAGIDLSRPFFVSPNDPRYNEILTRCDENATREFAIEAE